MSSSTGLRERIALVTGGSIGLGRATALALAADGADVAVLARGSTDLEETAEQVRAAGVRARAVVVDLADAKSIEWAMGQVRADLGTVDVLVNAAGTDVPGPVVSSTSQPGANAAAYRSAKFGLTGLTRHSRPTAGRTASAPVSCIPAPWTPAGGLVTGRSGRLRGAGPVRRRAGSRSGRPPDQLDRVRPTGRGAQRGHHHPTARAGMAVGIRRCIDIAATTTASPVLALTSGHSATPKRPRPRRCAR
ncbi:SDR family NAD(P)-dependent oxidoreductase [Geodermatophilus sp. DSM 45219]|uniref:SDR family NAD(P)-dependent oxidoreductase n=1 Tax=Geodermatophilus sp. DSM 45219 TaxID=1881103 RepID=UPI001C40AB2B